MMKRSRKFAWIVELAAVLVAWHGILLSVPHTHGSKDVPRYAAVCTATGSGSTAVHLHPAAELLPSHGCLACLVASAHGAPAAEHQGALVFRAVPSRAGRVICRRSDTHRYLPSLRAPPSRA